MSALLYIVRKSVKNSLRELVKKPGKLALYVLVLAFIGATVVTSGLNAQGEDGAAPLFILTGILFAVTSLFAIMAAMKGTSNGDAIFEMNDVNLLFVSPVSPRKVLLYGILRLAKVSFAATFFTLFQAGILAIFGVGFAGVFVLFFGFMTCVVVLSIVSLAIYSATNGNARRKLAAKCLAFAPFAPLAVFLAARLLESGDALAALEAAVASPLLAFLPVAGWTAAGVTAIFAGELAAGLMFLGANLLLGAGLAVFLLKSNPDYYEDTLVATETAYEKKRALADGNINAATGAAAAKVKVTKTGISGQGASALFRKHLRESFRQSRMGFLTPWSLMIVAGAAVMSFFTRDLVTVLQILMWIQLFMIGTGRGLKETYSHYVYLIPEPSFAKIVWSNMETMIKALVEGALVFGISGALVGANVLVIIGCIAAYALFSFLLLGVNYVFMRFVGADVSRGLLILIYVVAAIVAMLPGLVPALLVGAAIGGTPGVLVGLLILSAWELVAGIICFALSKGVLHRCDMPSAKTGGVY